MSGIAPEALEVTQEHPGGATRDLKLQTHWYLTVIQSELQLDLPALTKKQSD